MKEPAQVLWEGLSGHLDDFFACVTADPSCFGRCPIHPLIPTVFPTSVSTWPALFFHTKPPWVWMDSLVPNWVTR